MSIAYGLGILAASASPNYRPGEILAAHLLLLLGPACLAVVMSPCLQDSCLGDLHKIYQQCGVFYLVRVCERMEPCLDFHVQMFKGFLASQATERTWKRVACGFDLSNLAKGVRLCV